jgi:hypothetical protein
MASIVSVSVAQWDDLRERPHAPVPGQKER